MHHLPNVDKLVEFFFLTLFYEILFEKEGRYRAPPSQLDCNNFSLRKSCVIYIRRV